MIVLFGVVLLLVAAFATDTALDLVPVTAQGSHMVRLATLGAFPHCVTSRRATIHYAGVHALRVDQKTLEGTYLFDNTTMYNTYL